MACGDAPVNGNRRCNRKVDQQLGLKKWTVGFFSYGAAAIALACTGSVPVAAETALSR